MTGLFFSCGAVSKTKQNPKDMNWPKSFISGDNLEDIQSTYAAKPSAPTGEAAPEAEGSDTERAPKLTHHADRVVNMEALTLAFAVEHNLSMNIVPDLIAFAKVFLSFFPHKQNSLLHVTSTDGFLQL